MSNFIADVGPYTMVSRDEQIKHGDRRFRLVLYGAFNAMGLIGSECNGILLLDDDLKQVVFDEHTKIGSGYYGPSKLQTDEFFRIVMLSADEFVTFVNANSRLRQPIELKIRAHRKPTFEMRDFVALAQGQYLGYDAAKKAEFLRLGQLAAHQVAKALGLSEDDYDVRINRGGIAVCGDIYLHSDTLYVNFAQSSLNPDTGFMYRSCRGRADYTGGPNQRMAWEQLLDLDVAAEILRQTIEVRR